MADNRTSTVVVVFALVALIAIATPVSLIAMNTNEGGGIEYVDVEVSFYTDEGVVNNPTEIKTAMENLKAIEITEMTDPDLTGYTCKMPSAVTLYKLGLELTSVVGGDYDHIAYDDGQGGEWPDIMDADRSEKIFPNLVVRFVIGE